MCTDRVDFPELFMATINWCSYRDGGQRGERENKHMTIFSTSMYQEAYSYQRSLEFCNEIFLGVNQQI